jgi:hypothetical protein
MSFGRKLQAYKTAAVHNFLPPDCKARILYCRSFQESVFNGLQHNFKVGVRYAVNAWRATGCMFCHETIILNVM